VADLLAGEVRWWFVTHPEFLAFKSGRTLLNARELTAFHMAKTHSGNHLKPERRSKMPSGLWRKIVRADNKSVFPCFHSSLANDLLNCVAKYGEIRHIDLARREIIDSPDNK
jgi:hypothetical protein